MTTKRTMPTTDSIEKELNAIADTVSTPPTSREQIMAAENLRKRDALERERVGYENQRTLIAEVFKNANEAIDTNIADIDRALALCPAEVPSAPAGNVVSFAQDAAE